MGKDIVCSAEMFKLYPVDRGFEVEGDIIFLCIWRHKIQS